MVKSYTDLEQSKMLAQILPRTSADLYWGRDLDDDRWYIKVGPYSNLKFMAFGPDPDTLAIPAWSLAELFDALPKTIYQYSKNMGYFDNSYYCEYLNEDGENVGFRTTADNLLDTVFKMIILLKEKGLLCPTKNINPNISKYGT